MGSERCVNLNPPIFSPFVLSSHSEVKDKLATHSQHSHDEIDTFNFPFAYQLVSSDFLKYVFVSGKLFYLLNHSWIAYHINLLLLHDLMFVVLHTFYYSCL